MSDVEGKSAWPCMRHSSVSFLVWPAMLAQDSLFGGMTEQNTSSRVMLSTEDVNHQVVV